MNAGRDRAHEGASGRVYARLLQLYPRAFRDRYQAQMVQLFTDQLRDARSTSGARGVAAAWLRGVIDLASSAMAEQFRRDRTVAQSLATFQPTLPMRLLGVIGMSGALVLLAPFVALAPFEDFKTNLVRLAWFGSAGAAIALGYYPRLAVDKPRLAFVVTAMLAALGALYVGVAVAELDIAGGFKGPLGVHMLSANGPLWITGAMFGGIVLWIGSARRGLAPWADVAARIGAVALLLSAVAVLGDDPALAAVALSGVFLHGVGWLLLGSVLLIGNRGPQPN